MSPFSLGDYYAANILYSANSLKCILVILSDHLKSVI